MTTNATPRSRTTRPAAGRDRYIDFLRAFSLGVVVLWHWGFTILHVSVTSVSPTSPIGSTPGLWSMTWLLQVMPVFFFVGGFTHLLAFARDVPDTSGRFVVRRLRRLLTPALGLTVVWVGVGLVLRQTVRPAWTWSAVVLVLSPLWFLAVYAVLVVLAPVAIRAHRRWGELVPVWLVGLAAVLDVARFVHGIGWAAWGNFLVIWGLAHQLGFFYERLVAAGRRVGWMFLWGGLLGLVAITNIGLYPRSMVGVPGDRFSNMGPPTLAIVALILLQVGIVLLARDRVLRLLDRRGRCARAAAWLTDNGLPLYLFHSSGMAVVVAVAVGLLGYRLPAEPTPSWWASRPIWIIGPFLATWPLLAVYRRHLDRQRTSRGVHPSGPSAPRASGLRNPVS